MNDRVDKTIIEHHNCVDCELRSTLNTFTIGPEICNGIKFEEPIRKNKGRLIKTFIDRILEDNNKYTNKAEEQIKGLDKQVITLPQAEMQKNGLKLKINRIEEENNIDKKARNVLAHCLDKGGIDLEEAYCFLGVIEDYYSWYADKLSKEIKSLQDTVEEISKSFDKNRKSKGYDFQREVFDVSQVVANIKKINFLNDEFERIELKKFTYQLILIDLYKIKMSQ